MNVDVENHVIVIDDNVEIKVIRNDNDYKLIILKPNVGKIDVDFTDDVSMFEE